MKQATFTPKEMAAAILADIQSGNSRQRNAAIILLGHCDVETRTFVELEVTQKVAAYDGPEDHMSDWHAMDSEPFVFPEEPTNFLTEKEGE